MLSMKLEYLKTSSNVVQYLESLILVPKSKSISSDWNKRFYLKGDVLRNGTSNLVLLCQNRQIHGNLLWKPRRNRKWCLPLCWSKIWLYLEYLRYNCILCKYKHNLTFCCFSFSGNIVIETKFYDDNLLISTSRVRLFYVWHSNSRVAIYYDLKTTHGCVETSYWYFVIIFVHINSKCLIKMSKCWMFCISVFILQAPLRYYLFNCSCVIYNCIWPIKCLINSQKYWWYIFNKC